MEVYGTRSAPGLRKLVSQDNADFGLQLDFMWHVNGDGDHYSFFEHNIPFLMLHTGVHDNYHRPSDDAELIKPEGMQAITQLMFRVCTNWPKRTRCRSSAPRHATNRLPCEPSSNGRSPMRRRDSACRGARRRRAGLDRDARRAGSAADQGGLRVGDRIVRFDGRDVTDGDQFQLIVLAAPRSRRPWSSDPVRPSR